jgi:hypothetical protein
MITLSYQILSRNSCYFLSLFHVKAARAAFRNQGGHGSPGVHVAGQGSPGVMRAGVVQESM